MVTWKPLAVKIVVAEIAKNVFTVVKWLQKHFVLLRNIKTNALHREDDLIIILLHVRHRHLQADMKTIDCSASPTFLYK